MFVNTIFFLFLNHGQPPELLSRQNITHLRLKLPFHQTSLILWSILADFFFKSAAKFRKVDKKVQKVRPHAAKKTKIWPHFRALDPGACV